ncbi:hypothetical protein [Sphingopyxis sp. H115]|nr:hypothetical protein [Sphingopyxis sp. H115]
MADSERGFATHPGSDADFLRFFLSDIGVSRIADAQNVPLAGDARVD